ncbi:DNA sulfur modification protein DndB [Polyangium mundeleinium]|nr:DNA sulfur modification protein DndB [Polyangium mundeleinium]
MLSPPAAFPGRSPQRLSGANSTSWMIVVRPHSRVRSGGKSAVEFWTEVTRVMPLWHEVGLGKVRAAELREKYVHGHAVTLEALGRAGNALLRERREDWKSVLAGLGMLNWSRASLRWEGRAVVNGRIAKNAASVILTANLIKVHLGLELFIEDRRHESVLVSEEAQVDEDNMQGDGAATAA